MKTSFKNIGLMAAAASFLALMPLGSQPHLLQKIQLLKNGWLKQPADIFDLMMHGFLLVIVIVYAILYLVRNILQKKE